MQLVPPYTLEDLEEQIANESLETVGAYHLLTPFHLF
jgi:hypothetical protein